MKERDEIEEDYIFGIKEAMLRGDSDYALELAIGLRQYRELFKS